MWLGEWKDKTDEPFGFKWPKEPINALGDFFPYNQESANKLNFGEKILNLEKTLNTWQRRNLTLCGKINIVKTLGLSKLIYSVSVLPVPDRYIQEINKRIFNFIWAGKPPKIKRNTIIREKNNGGLKMCDFKDGPTIVIAGTFCASPDTRLSYLRCLLIQGYFCEV